MIRLGNDGLPIGRKRSNYSNIDGVLHKRCTHCGNHYRLSYFYPLKYRRNGVEYETLQSWCKFCMTTEINENIKKKNNMQVMNKQEILQSAFNEGTRYIGKEFDAIHSLAEEYVQAQPYVDISKDDAIYEEFVKGATTSKQK